MTKKDNGKLLRFFGWSVLLLLALSAFAEQVTFETISRAIIESRLKSFSRDDTEREAILKRLFGDAGCAEFTSEQSVKDVHQPNLICTLPGLTSRTIIVGGHFDHAEKGDGVVDNWSGASLLPSLYQSLRGTPRQHTFIFVAFTGEEKGELGSEAYVHSMSKEEVARTDAMVNMDTLGLGPSEVWVSQADPKLVQRIIAVAAVFQLPVRGVNVEEVGSTDSVQFARRKIPSITVHSLTQQTMGILHSPRDKLEAIHLDDYYNTYRLVAAYLAYLDYSLSPTNPQSPQPAKP